MSGLDSLAAGAGGALVSQLWKASTVALAAVLMAVGGATGTGWWMASTARDQALADLKAAQTTNGTLMGSLDIQNTAIVSMGAAVKLADGLREQAERRSASAIKSANARAAAAKASTATSCDAVLREAWGAK